MSPADDPEGEIHPGPDYLLLLPTGPDHPYVNAPPSHVHPPPTPPPLPAPLNKAICCRQFQHALWVPMVLWCGLVQDRLTQTQLILAGCTWMHLDASSSCWLHVCRCLEHGQQQARAEEACRKALANCPASSSAVLQLAKLLHGSSKHQAALETLEQGLQQLSSTSNQSQDPQLALVSHYMCEIPSWLMHFMYFLAGVCS